MANYGTESGFEAYAEERSYTVPSGEPLPALVRSSFWIDGEFGARFNGVKAGGRSQVLAWPRTGATDREGLPVTGVPIEIEYATYEAALRELASPGSLNPDVAPGKIKKRVKVEGAVEVEYAVGQGTAAEQRPVVGVVEGLLVGLLVSTTAEPWALVV